MLSFTLSFFPYFVTSLVNVWAKNQIWFSIILNLTKNWFNIWFCLTIFFFLIQRWGFLIYMYLYKLIFTVSFLHKKFIISQLLLGFNNIHPVLFYLSFFFIFLTYWQLETIFFFKRVNNLLVGSCALLLGGWWGLGNSVWGFFWVNDFIECILFYLLLYFVFYIHSIFLVENFSQYYLGFGLILVLLFALRWGFLFTRHNFFNILSLNNLIVVFFLKFFIACFIILYFLVICFSINLIVYSLFFFLSYNYFAFNSFAKKIVWWHLFFLIVCFTWFKFKEHVNTIFIRGSLVNLNLTIFSPIQQFFFLKFLSIERGVLQLFIISTFCIYGKKFLLTTYVLILAYHIFIFLIILLKSIIKIYTK